MAKSAEEDVGAVFLTQWCAGCVQVGCKKEEMYQSINFNQVENALRKQADEEWMMMQQQWGAQM